MRELTSRKSSLGSAIKSQLSQDFFAETVVVKTVRSKALQKRVKQRVVGVQAPIDIKNGFIDNKKYAFVNIVGGKSDNIKLATNI
jgi:hypothetical protein